MLRALLLSTLSSILFSATCLPSTAQAWPTKAFDATYQSTAAGQTTVMRQISDGRGHMRTESSTPQGRVISIIDYPNKVVWSLMEAQKMAMKMPFNPNAAGPAVRDAESARQYNSKPLGAKVIDGHPCHGWQTTVQGTTSESWIGDDINNLVYSVTSGPYGQSSMRLKSYSADQPSPS
ncbi:MAG TPA: DUF4412 domain-containing protein, partial [Candidatus Obscuribacterales bacterium]